MKGTNGGRISSNGFNGYTSHQKENWANSKRIVIYDSAGQLSGFVDEAIAGKNLDKKLYFGTVSKAVGKRIYNATGLDVEGYNCSPAADEVRKILKDHGDEKNEDKRGQRAITKEDFALIPDIVNNADKVVLSTRKYNNRPVINFVKDINGRITVTAYVSQRHIDLTVQTMFSGKKRSLATATDEHASVNTPKAANGTASIDTMPQTSEDVKFSRKDDVSVTAKDVQKLQKENDKLTQALDLVRQELKITQGHHVKPAVIDRLAGRILTDYQSTMPKTELVESITQLFDYIGNGERVIWDEVQAGAMNIALNVLDKSTQRNTEWYDATKPARDYLKDTAIKLNDKQLEEVGYAFGSYNDFRRALFGKATVSRVDGIPLEQAWRDLSGMFPDVFDPDTADVDMPVMLYNEVLGMYDRPIENPYGYDLRGYASDLAMQLYDAYMSAPEVNTFADKQQKKLDLTKAH